MAQTPSILSQIVVGATLFNRISSSCASKKEGVQNEGPAFRVGTQKYRCLRVVASLLPKEIRVDGVVNEFEDWTSEELVEEILRLEESIMPAIRNSQKKKTTAISSR